MDNNEELEKLRAQLAEKEQIELSLKAELANKDIQFEQSELAKKELQKENEILKEKEIINKKIPDKDKDKDKDKEAQDKAEQEKQAQADKEAQAKEEQAKKDQADKDEQAKKESQSKEEQAKKEQADKEAQAKEEQAKKDQEKEPDKDKDKEVNQIADKVVADRAIEENGSQRSAAETKEQVIKDAEKNGQMPDPKIVGDLGARFERSQQRHTSDCKVRDEIKAMSPEQYKELETKMNKEHGKEGQKLTHEGVVAFACEDKHKELGIQRDSIDRAVARGSAPGVAEEMDKRAAARYEPDKEAIKAKEAERPPEIKPNLGQSNNVGMSR